jgi:hypothetical protein
LKSRFACDSRLTTTEVQRLEFFQMEIWVVSLTSLPGLVQLPPSRPGMRSNPRGTPGLGSIQPPKKNGRSFNPLPRSNTGPHPPSLHTSARKENISSWVVELTPQAASSRGERQQRGWAAEAGWIMRRGMDGRCLRRPLPTATFPTTTPPGEPPILTLHLFPLSRVFVACACPDLGVQTDIVQVRRFLILCLCLYLGSSSCTWGLVVEVVPCVEDLYHVISAKCEMIAASLCGPEMLNY